MNELYSVSMTQHHLGVKDGSGLQLASTACVELFQGSLRF